MTFEDDDRRLVQVASIVNAFAAAENATPWKVLVRLSEYAVAGVLPARLYTTVRTRTVDSACASPDESLGVWRNMARQTDKRKRDLLNYYLPPAASTWFVHAGDLIRFVEAAQMSEEAKVSLRALARSYSGPVAAAIEAVPVVVKIATPIAPTLDLVTAIATPMSDSSKSRSIESWIEFAQREARHIVKRQAKLDLFPSQIDIADEIAVLFRRHVPQVVGADGKPLTGSTIKRHALRGISSAVKKVQSTSKRRGK